MLKLNSFKMTGPEIKIIQVASDMHNKVRTPKMVDAFMQQHLY